MLRSLSPRQWEVLQAVADGRVQRDLLGGTFEPYLLGGDDVVWTLRALTLRGLILFQPLGPPVITRRGWRALNSTD